MSGNGQELDPQLASGQLMLTSTIEAVEDACLCFDQDLVILAANAAAQRLFGHTADELIGRRCEDFIHPDMEGLFLHTNWIMAKADWRDVELTTGTGAAIRLVMSSVFSSSQDAKVATALFRPASDAGAARQLADGFHPVMHRFLSSMSHELRTPLNAIIGFSDIIGQEVLGAATPQKYSEYARDINGAARHMLDLISDILDYSQIEQNQRLVDIATVDIASAIRFSAGLAKPMAERANVSIRLQGLDTPLLVQADERAVRQIALNLIMNAIRYNKDGGTVQVTSRQESDRGALDVEDTGIGIEDDDFEKIFDPFTTLQDKPYYSQDGGVGLGLTIVRRLADAMDADITVRSVPAQGTMMTVTFPLA